MSQTVEANPYKLTDEEIEGIVKRLRNEGAHAFAVGTKDGMQDAAGWLMRNAELRHLRQIVSADALDWEDLCGIAAEYDGWDPEVAASCLDEATGGVPTYREGYAEAFTQAVREAWVKIEPRL